MTPTAQRANVRIAAMALAELARDHQIVVAHRNDPQVGLLALQGAAYDPNAPWPLDVLGAETKGMIGYLIEQELMNALPQGATAPPCLAVSRWMRTTPHSTRPANRSAQSIRKPKLPGRRTITVGPW